MTVFDRDAAAKRTGVSRTAANARPGEPGRTFRRNKEAQQESIHGVSWNGLPTSALLPPTQLVTEKITDYVFSPTKISRIRSAARRTPLSGVIDGGHLDYPKETLQKWISVSAGSGGKERQGG